MTLARLISRHVLNFTVLSRVIAALLVLTMFSDRVLALVDSDGDGVDDIREGIDGTDPNDADSFIEHILGKRCIHWNKAVAGLSTVAEVRNAGCSDMTLRFDVHDLDGTSETVGTLGLEPTEEIDLLVDLMNGAETGRFGTLCATMLSGDVDTLDFQAAVYTTDSQTFTLGMSVPTAQARAGRQYLGFNHNFPTLSPDEVSNAVAIYLQVSNDDGAAGYGDFVYYDSDGNEIHRDEDVFVSANGRTDVASHTVDGDRVGMVEWIPQSVHRLYRLAANRYYFDSNNFASGFRNAVSIASTLPSGHLRGAPFNTRGKVVVLELSNVLSIPISVPLSVFAAAGSATAVQPGNIAIPAKGTRHIVLNTFLPNGLGTVQLGTTAHSSVIATLIEYGIGADLQLRFATASSPSSGFGEYQTATYNNFLGGCRLRLANLVGTTQSPAIRATRSDGTVLTLGSPVEVPAHGAVEVDICAAESTRGYGELRITPTVEESIVSDIVRSNQDGTSEIRAIGIERSQCVAAVSVSPSTLSLTASSGTPGTLTVTNTSNGVTALDIHATLPGSWSDVSQDASACALLAPGASCPIVLTPGASVHTAQTIPVSGSNVPGIDAVVSVTAAPAAILSITGSPLSLTVNGQSGDLIVTNTSTTITAQNIAANVSGTALDGNVTVGNTCLVLAPQQSCAISFTPGSSTVAQTNFPIAGSNTNTVIGAVSIVSPPMTTLSASVSVLALSINSPGSDPALTGNPRTIQITNTGTIPAENLSTMVSMFPLNTSITSNTCTGTLGAGSTCGITITPGDIASPDVSNMPSTTAPGTVPILSEISVSADNATAVEIDTVILGYGTIWAGGHVFAIDDTTPATQSVIGKVAALTDESSSLGWSTIFDDTAADSLFDGASNTVSLITPIGQYPAAQACQAKASGGYADWYLPAVCELGRFVGLGSDPGCGTTIPNLYATLYVNGLGSLSNDVYFSSSESNISPTFFAWGQDFLSGSLVVVNKSSMYSVRCVRSF